MTDLGLNIVDCYQNMPKVCRYAIFQIFTHHFLVKFGWLFFTPLLLQPFHFGFDAGEIELVFSRYYNIAASFCPPYKVVVCRIFDFHNKVVDIIDDTFILVGVKLLP